MFKQWIIGLVISFVMRQILKWRDQVDWAKVKADLAVRIRALIPGEWFDNDVIELAYIFLDMVKEVLDKTDEIETILTLLSEQKWQEAWDKIRDLILGNVEPKTEKEKYVVECIKECKLAPDQAVMSMAAKPEAPKKKVAKKAAKK